MKTLLRLLLALVATAALRGQSSPDPAAASRANLKSIAGAIKAYGLLYEGKRPNKLSALLDEGLVDSAAVFVNPASGRAIPARADVDAKGDYTMDPLPAAPDLLLREKEPTHTPGKVLAVLKSGAIEFVAAPPGLTASAPSEPSPAPAQPAASTASLPPPSPPPLASPTSSAAPASTPPPAVLAPAEAPPPAYTSAEHQAPAVTGPTPPDTTALAARLSTPGTSLVSTVGESAASTAVPAAPPLAPAPSGESSELAPVLAAANNALAQMNVAEAQRLFGDVLQHDPSCVDALIGTARCHNALGELQAALGCYYALQRMAPNTPNLRTWLAEILIAKHDFPEARRLLNEELAAQPASAWAMSWLGTLELEAGNTTSGANLLRHAPELDANVVTARYQNANWLDRTNQPERALVELKSVETMNPNLAGVYFGLGSCYAKLGRLDLARQNYERYLQLDPSSQWAPIARTEIVRLKSTR